MCKGERPPPADIGCLSPQNNEGGLCALFGATWTDGFADDGVAGDGAVGDDTGQNLREAEAITAPAQLE